MVISPSPLRGGGQVWISRNKNQVSIIHRSEMLLCLDLGSIWAGVIDKKWLERLGGGVIRGPKRSKMSPLQN